MDGIFLIAPYRKLAALASEIALELGIILEIKFGKLEEGVHLARQALKEGAAVIVSQGATGWLIARENLPVPVVEIIPTGYDLLRAAGGAGEGQKGGNPRPSRDDPGCRHPRRNPRPGNYQGPSADLRPDRSGD